MSQESIAKINDWLAAMGDAVGSGEAKLSAPVSLEHASGVIIKPGHSRGK